MFTSLRTRLWVSYALLIATALGVMTVAFGLYLWRNPLLYRQTLARLRTVESGIVKRQGELFDQSLPMIMDRASHAYNLRILQFNQNGDLIKDTSPSEADIELPGKRVLNRKIPTLRDGNGNAWLYSQKKLDDGTILVVTTRRPRVPLLVILRDDLMPIILQGGGIALLFSLALAYGLAHWIGDPLQELIRASVNEPTTETIPVDERGPREVRELTRAFNAMVARVSSSQASQKKFVADVSHELKTPLTSVQGFAQAIIDGTASTSDEQKQAAEVIFNEAGRMHSLVLDLLDLARLDAGIADLEMSQIDIHALLGSIIEKFDLQARKCGLNLKSDIAPNLPILIADGDRLAQVFTNLVDNAITHTPGGGQVILQVLPSQAEIEFRVADTGEGIDPDVLPRIFDRFNKIDTSRSGGDKQGTGLGLAIAKEIITAHNGRITVRSQEGLGTTLIVHLPLNPSEVSTLVRRK